jgi:4-oxalocrotonate tautomerase
MPHVSIKLYQGRSKEELDKISSNIQNCLVETVGWNPNAISVSVEEIEPEKFVEKVKREIESEEIIIASDFIR